MVFPSLETLDISYNKLSGLAINAAWLPRDLEVLNVSGNDIDNFKIIVSEKFSTQMSLKELDARHNQISTLPIIEIPKSATTGLISFYFGDNPFNCDCKVLWLHNLITLQNSNTETYVIRNSETLSCQSLYRHEPGLMRDMKPENFLCEYNKSCPELCKCYQNDHVNIVDCKNNNITAISNEISTDSKVLDLSGNSISVLEPNNFDGLSQLEELLINSNQISEVNTGTFRNLSDLRKLDLAQNQLSALQMDMFEGLVGLETLDLRFNQINRVEKGSFQAMKSLKYLNIRGNQLKTISNTEFTSFAQIQSLKLSQNPWPCECAFVEIMKRFMNQNAKRIDDFDDIACEYYDREKNKHMKHFLFDVHKPEFCMNDAAVVKILDNTPVISISVVLSVIIVALIIVIVIFKHRKFLKIWCFVKFRRKFHCDNENDEANRPYDAFISYSSKDVDIVAREIVPHLEEPRNGREGYKLCVRDRDFPAGAGIAETINEAVNKSKRVLVIVSDNYLKSEWCQYEFQKANHQLVQERKNRIIIILLEEVNPDLIYKEIGLYLRTRTYVKYDDPWLWPKVEYDMPDTKAIINPGNQNHEDDRVEFIPLDVMAENV